MGDTALLSTLVSLPDGERAAVERELVPLLRAAALGELAADVAHDVANPLFGVLGLVDLLLEDAAPGSEGEARLQLLRQTALEMKGTLQALLDYARAPTDGTEADPAAAAQAALTLVRRGIGKRLVIEERYPQEPVRVACGQARLTQAILHLLLAARGAGGAVVLEVEPLAIRVSPAGGASVGTAAAGRIAADHGGGLTVEDGAWVLRLPAA